MSEDAAIPTGFVLATDRYNAIYSMRPKLYWENRQDREWLHRIRELMFFSPDPNHS